MREHCPFVYSCPLQLHHNYPIEVFDNAIETRSRGVYANHFIVVGGFDFMQSHSHLPRM